MDNNIEEKKRKSILNNSYTTGENLKGNDFEFYSSVKVDDVGASIFMKDSCDFDSILYGHMVDFVYDLISNDNDLKELIESKDISSDKKDELKIDKYSSDEINFLFERIFNEIMKEEEFSKFMKISYLFEIIHNITNMSFDILFNTLNYYNKATTIELFQSEVDIDFFE